MKHFIENIVNQAGVPVPNASVTVLNAGTQIQAAIFSDDGLTAKVNPVITDSLGRFDFFVADGRYDLAVAGSTILPFTISNVEIASVETANSTDLPWNTERIQFVNHTDPQAAPPAGSLAVYSKASNRHLFTQDETGAETDLTTAGANILPLNNVFTGTNEFDKNVSFKGPNPYVDVTTFGARAGSPNTTPYAVGLTANCISGNSQVSISSASTLINGDGVVLYGCGAAHAMPTPAAPTVTPSIARGMTGTGDVVNGPNGTNTVCYKVVAEDFAGGLTAASPETCINTGANLGYQSIPISSVSRTNDTRTYVTSAPHGLPVGCGGFGATGCPMVLLDGFSSTDGQWSGWYLVGSVADSTHFTVALDGLDTRNGALTVPNGAGTGTLHYWNCNHVTWNAVPGAYRYYVYAGASGAETLLRPSTFPVNPKNSIFVDGTLNSDDFGAAMTSSITSMPAWVPTTPPASATSDYLVTTISSGAGTTTLSLANAASTTISGTSIRLDAAPALKAAVAANYVSRAGPCLYFPVDPVGGSYVLNSNLDLDSASPAICAPGKLQFNATLLSGDGTRMYGDRMPAKGSASSGQFQSNPSWFCNASPCIHINNGQTGTFQGFDISAGSNAAIAIFQDGGFANPGTQFNDVQINVGGLLGIGFVCRGATGAQCVTGGRSLGIQSGTGNTATPALYIDIGQMVNFDKLYFIKRAMLVRPDNGGLGVRVGFGYINGGVTPFLTVLGLTNTNVPASVGLLLGDEEGITLDTIAQPGIVNLQLGTGFVGATWSGNTPSFPSPPLVTGTRLALFQSNSISPVSSALLGMNRNAISTFSSTFGYDGFFSASSPASGITTAGSALSASGPIFTFPGSAIGVAAPPMAPPTIVSVTAGGNVPVGSHTYTIVPMYQNGGEGLYSSSSATATTTTGNQTVNLSWTPRNDGCKGYDIYRDGNFLQTGTFPSVIGCSASSLADTFPVASGTAATGAPAYGMPTMLMPGLQGIATPALTLGGNLVTAPTAGTLAVSTGSPVSGNLARYSSPAGTLVDSGVASGSLATIPLAVGNLSPGANGQCVNTSGSVAVWGSCAGTAGVQVVNLNTAQVNDTTAGPVTLMSFTFPSGSLATIGKSFRVSAYGLVNILPPSGTVQVFASVLNNQTGGGITPWNSNVLSSAGTWGGSFICTNTTGTTGGICTSSMLFQGQPVAPVSAAVQSGIMTWTGTVTVTLSMNFSATGGSGNQSYMLVEQLN